MFECRLIAFAPVVGGLVSAITATAVLRADSFTLIASMHMARSGHQATLLDDGRVLVTGGSDDSGAATGRVEVFNPVTRSWADAEPIAYARVEHAATLLQDGRVVVVGGASTTSSCEPIAAAEIYESRTGTWSLTRDAPIALAHGPAAVRLADHRVLVSGGGTPCGSISRSAAIFDPVSNAWLPTSSMNVARQFHIAVLMRDGRVLVTGGALTRDGELADAEAYDPATREWTIVPRGPVLLGTTCDGYMPSFAALLDPVRSIVSRATDSFCSSTTVLPRTRFLVAGGTVASGRRLESAEVFEPLTEGRTLTGPLLSASAGHTATRLVNGSVLVAGGNDAANPTAAAEIWIPEIQYASPPIAVGRAVANRNGRFYYGVLLAAVVNSKRHMLISYTGGNPTTRILEWNLIEGRVKEPTPYEQEIGKGFDEFHAIRIDKDDNIWAVAPTANEVYKFSPIGELLLRFGAAPAIDPDAAPPAPPLPRLARPYLNRPVDVVLDRAGNVFVLDGGNNPRLARFDERGRFVAAAGGRGAKLGELNSPHSLAVDANGNVYVADGGNARIQVFSSALVPVAVYDTVGSPWALCITGGAHQYLFSASNPDRTDVTKGDLQGEIYKLELDGTIVGRFGRSDNSGGRFKTPHFIHCTSDDELIEISITDDFHFLRLLPR
jgi:NHL repeat-containing protein/galactose oxidase-like protein